MVRRALRTAGFLALWALPVAGATLAVVLALATEGRVGDSPWNSALWLVASAVIVGLVATIGVTLAANEPRRGIGWAVCAFCLGLAASVLSQQYVDYAAVEGRFGIEPDWAALVGHTTLAATLLATPFLLVFSPEGRSRSRAWRLVTLPAALLVLTLLALLMLSPGPLRTVPSVENPIGVDVLAGADTIALWFALPAWAFVLLLGVSALPRTFVEEETGEEELSEHKRRKREKRRRKVEGPKRAFDFFKDLPRVWPYLRPYWTLAASSILLLVVGVLVGLMVPWPLAILLDAVIGTDPLPSLLGFLADWDRTDLLILAVSAGLIVAALQSSVGVVDTYVLTRLEQQMTLDVRSELFAHVQGLSQSFHDRKKTGGLMFAINMQAASLGGVVVALPPLVQAVGTLVGMFVIAFIIDAELALIALSVVPFIYLSTGIYAKRIEPRLYYVRNLEAQSLSIVYEAMSMLRVIVTFGREKHEHGKFRAQAAEAAAARISLTVKQTLFSLVVSVLTAAGTALVLGVGAWHVLQGQLTAGELVILMSYIGAVYLPLEQISATIATLQEQFINLRSALDLLDMPQDIKDSPDAKKLERAEGRVTFEEVSFRHKGRKTRTLDRISFDVAPCSRVGIVGPTGAGKTSLVSLIPRFYEAKRGRILIDGIDIKDLTLASLRAQVSIVHQEPMLFASSIMENIRYAKLEATDEEVMAAAEAANAHDFITALPEGYDTELAEGGGLLSVGERQRVAIARAFLKDAPILILDEPTAAVDSRTELVIIDALDRLAEKRTTFTIAHRLATVGRADVLLVLDGGRLVEQGTHEELLARAGLYRQMHDVQRGQPALHVVEEKPPAEPESANPLVAALRTLLDAPPERLDTLATSPGEPLEIRIAAGILGVLSREDVTRLRTLRDSDLARMLEDVRK